MARSKRNEFVAGLFILVALVAMAAVLVVTADLGELGREKAIYHVAFDEAPMVRQGSPVQLGGQAAGRVIEIKRQWRTATDGEATAFYYVLALQVPADIELRRDARVGVETAVIGGDAAVNIRSVGVGKLAIDTATHPIEGRSGDMIATALASLGIGPEEKKQISETIANVHAVTASLRKTAPKIEKTVDDIKAITGDLHAKLPDIVASINETTNSIKSASANIDAILKENRENIKTSITNVAELTEKAKKQVGDLLVSLNEASGHVKTLIAANRVNLNDTMLNLRQTSEQLKAASVEIRRAPWRLLYEPGKREADTMNIHDASRNYARALADLRSVSTTLRTLLEVREAGTPVDEAMIKAMVSRLKAGFEKYEEAEAALWKEWEKANK
jgi:phospholipid/cholesterol/gamma-HCH transport system substrate-binding protein